MAPMLRVLRSLIEQANIYMSIPRNVGEAFRPPAGDLKVAPTSRSKEPLGPQPEPPAALSGSES